MEIGFYILFAICAGFIAGRKNYSVITCMLLGVLGVVGLLVACILPRKPPKQIGR